MSNNKYSFLFTSFSQVLFSNLSRSAFGFLTSVLVFRFFEVESVSVLYTLLSLMIIGQQLGDLGLTSSFVKFASQYREEDPQRYKSLTRSVFLIKGAIALSLYLLFGVFLTDWVKVYFYESSLSRGYLSATFFFTSVAIVGSYFYSLLEVEQKFFRVSVLRAVAPLIKLILMAALVWTGRTELFFLFIAFMMAPFISGVLGAVYAPKNFMKETSYFRRDVKEIYQFSFWLAVAALAGTLFSQVDILMLKKLSSDTAVAHFSAGQRIAALVLLISQALFTVLLPKLSATKDKATLKSFWMSCFKYSLLAFVVSVPLFYVLRPMLPILLGVKYEPSMNLFYVLALQYILITGMSTVSLIFYNSGSVWWLTILSGAQFLLNVYFNAQYIPDYGALGAALVSFCLAVLGFFGYFLFAYLEVERKY